MTELEGELYSAFEYSTDLFQPETIERMSDRFQKDWIYQSA
jgi:hypothetical protein